MEEQLNTFMEVPGFICPPEFWPSLGYGGQARYVAVYWELCGDEAAWHDGRSALAGAFWPAYQHLMAHNFSPGHPYHWLLGASDAEAMFWLVIDRETERAWLVPAGQATEILRSQWPGDVATDGLGVFTATAEGIADLMGLAAQLAPGQSLNIEQIEQAVAAEERDYRVLVEALQARPVPWQKEKP